MFCRPLSPPQCYAAAVIKNLRSTYGERAMLERSCRSQHRCCHSSSHHVRDEENLLAALGRVGGRACLGFHGTAAAHDTNREDPAKMGRGPSISGRMVRDRNAFLLMSYEHKCCIEFLF